MSTPSVRIETSAPGADAAARQLQEVAGAQNEIATAQQKAAAAADALTAKLNASKGALDKVQGGVSSFNAAAQGLKLAINGGVEGLSSFGLALSALPGPLGAVGGLVAAGVTTWQAFKTATEGATASIDGQTKKLPALWAAFKTVTAEVLAASDAQNAFQRAAAGIDRSDVGARVDPRRRQELMKLQAEEKKALAEVQAATEALDAAQRRELQTKQRAAAIAKADREAGRAAATVVSVQSGNIEKLSADLDFARSRLDSLRFAQEATAAVIQ